jgi:hypothetical protein
VRAVSGLVMIRSMVVQAMLRAMVADATPESI